MSTSVDAGGPGVFSPTIMLPVQLLGLEGHIEAAEGISLKRTDSSHTVGGATQILTLCGSTTLNNDSPTWFQVILPVQRVFTAPDVVTALKNAVPAVAKIIDEDGGVLRVGRTWVLTLCPSSLMRRP